MMKVGLLIPFSGQVSSMGQEIVKGLRIGCNGFDTEEVSIAMRYLNCVDIDRNGLGSNKVKFQKSDCQMI
ncbi:hypothetical protein IFO69_01320 [Echinicola sp. CAU 1574]|uniref:Uncharacterized protein n=1 Tax=Echinicola arenosa TaxID=2774144 RepID=A0ABR9AEZ4_9BACT|nr:hypothetical protein [Echinicola arenosa]MBD8487377.1 hypothetical protein [Echinicola arenosa]